MNRESWLADLVTRLRPIFADAGYELPGNVKVSVGWPSKGAVSRKRPVIGQCFYEEASVAFQFEIFISPILGDGLAAAETLVHELCHTLTDSKVGHTKPFQRIARRLGLEGPATATHAGEELQRTLRLILADLGTYPHAQMCPTVPVKKQTTRMHKVVCKQCGYVARVAAKWITVGSPICPTHAEPMAVEAPPPTEDDASPEEDNE